MKRIAAVIVSALFLAAFPAGADEGRDNTITVRGAGVLEIPADRAQVIFSVRETGRTLRDAVAAAGKKVAAVTAELVGLGLEPADLRTSCYSSGRNYYDRAFLSSKRDFEADMTVVTTIDDLTKLDPVVFALTESKIEELRSIDFVLKDKAGAVRKVLEAAARDAEAKADLLASALHRSKDSLLEAKEVETRVHTRPARQTGRWELSEARMADSYDMEREKTGLLPEVIRIEATVEATFTLK